MSARRAGTIGLLLLLASAAGACCPIGKAPGRCVACCYDNCIVPTFSSRAPTAREPPSPAAPGRARAMAY